MREVDAAFWPYAIWWMATAGFCYVLFGYPILLALQTRRRSPAVKKDPRYQPSVSVIMAVYNGAAELRAKLESLLALDYPAELVQIVVVSDGSTDATEAIAGEYRERGVVPVRVPHGGKSAALNRAMEVASGEILFFTDVRQRIDRGALRHLVSNLADPAVGAVSGELKLLSGDQGEQADMDLYWRFELWMRQRHSDIDSIFTTTGCIYAIRRQLVDPLPADTLTDDAVLALRVFFRNYRVVFDPLAVAFDHPALAGTEYRRRFRTLAGLWQVHTRFPQLFSRGNRMRWHFLSYKFGRLILPWTIVIAIAASFAMPPGWFRTILLILEAAPFALAILNGVVPRGWPLKRLASLSQTFLVMNGAAISSVAVFFVPATRIWKPTKVQAGE